MSEESTIAEKLDEAFMDLMVVELSEQKQRGQASYEPVMGDDTTDTLPPIDDAGFGESYTVESENDRKDDRKDGRRDDRDRSADATPLDPLPALDEEAKEEPWSAPHEAKEPESPSERSAAGYTGKVLLLVSEPDQKERAYRLHRKPVLVGRGKDAEIRLRDTMSSRQHLRIEKVDNRIMITDLNSQNGTRLNGQHIRRECEVISGDEIQVGATVIRVRREKE